MLNTFPFSFSPFGAPRRRLMLGTLVALILASLAIVIVITASANPPSAAQVRIQALVNELKTDRLTAARHNAQRELENAGEAAVSSLVTALHSDNVVLRRNSADMLGFIASPTASNALQQTLLNDPVPAVRQNAAWSLGEINNLSAVLTLERAAVLDTNAAVRQAAQDSLARVQTRVALVTGIDERALSAYAVAPSNAEIGYAATRRDLKITHNGGKTWSTLAHALPGTVDVLSVSPSDSQVLYAGIDGLGVYQSTDGGNTWHAMNKGLPVVPGGRYVVSAVTIDANNPQRIALAHGVMLGTGNVEFVPLGIAVTQDGGETWTTLSQNKTTDAVTRLAFEKTKLYALTGNRVLIYGSE